MHLFRHVFRFVVMVLEKCHKNIQRALKFQSTLEVLRLGICICEVARICMFTYFSLWQVYRGVRIGGLNMSLKHSQNKGAPHFPHDYPDCQAGIRFQEEQEAELLNKFKRSATKNNG